MASITIADRQFLLAPLSAGEELALGRKMRLAAKQQYGPGGLFAKMQPILGWMKENKMHAEHAAAVQQLTVMEANNEMPDGDALHAFRMTPDGLATEIFTRTRKTHPEVALPEIRALITSINAEEVFIGLINAITEKDDGTPGKDLTR